MTSPFIRKLEHSGFLTEADRATLGSVPIHRRHVSKSQDLIREGDRPENVLVIFEGFAGRYKLMPKGRRHIMALLVPGDFCDLHVALLRHMDHGICTLSDCEVAEVPRATVEHLAEKHHSITRALWWATLTDEAVLREWLANMGQRDASKQMAHLFCELLMRLQAVDCATGNAFDLPITQTELADVLGLSTVHVNRSLQELRSAGLVTLKGRRLEVPDVDQLNAYCDFNPNYLHIVPQVNHPSKIYSAPDKV